MTRSPRLLALVCLLFLLPLACGLASTPTATPRPTRTPPPAALPSPVYTLENTPTATPAQDTPTATSTHVPSPSPTPGLPTPVSAPGYAHASAQTDPQGRFTFTDPLNGRSLSVTVADRTTRQPLPGIAVTLVSSGAEVLLVATDPTGKHVPGLKEVRYAELGAASPGGAVQLVSYHRQSLETVLLLVAVVEIEQNLQDWWDFAQDLPDLERWGFVSQEVCVSNDQATRGMQAAVGSALLLFPPFEKAFPKFQDDIFVTFFTTLGDTALGDLIRDQIEALGLTLRPAITRWRLYHLGGAVSYLPARPVGWCLEPLNPADPQDILRWVRYGMDHADLYPFETLTTESAVGYVNYIEGGQTTPRQDFLADLDERLPSQPRCDGYYLYDNTLHIWTSGWAPAWVMTEMCYDGCWALDPPHTSSIASFFFYPSDAGYRLSALWLNDIDLWEQVYGVRLVGCDDPYPSQGFSNTPTAVSTATSQCAGARPSRLTVGKYAAVSTDPPLANRLRSGPGKSYPIVGKIQPGEVMQVLDGPRCADGWAWWKVRELDTGLIGWTAEGDLDAYWLVPCEDAATCEP